MKNIKNVFPYGLALLICVIVSLPVFSESIIMDEAYSMLLVKGSISDIISGSASDVHPPLYYLILKLTDLFPGGQTLCGYRLITTLATFLNLLWLGATVIRKRWGNRVAVIYILWYGLTHGTWERSALVRMYSWGTFFVATALLFLFAYYEKRKMRDYVAAILFTLAAMYTHYYAVIAMFVAWVILLAYAIVKERKLMRNVIVAGVIIVVGYLPWMQALISQSSRVANNYWINTFSWSDWIVSPAELMESSFPGIGIIFYVFSVVVLFLAIVQRKWVPLCGMAVFVGTMLFGAILSVTVTPIWTVRYLYMAWGGYALFIALVLGERRDIYATIAQGMVFVLLLGANVFAFQSLFEHQVMNTTADEWTDFLEEYVTEEDCMIVDDPLEHRIVYEFYSPGTEIIMTEELEDLGGTKQLEDILVQYKDKNIWYVPDHIQIRYGVEEMSNALKDVNCEMEHMASFTIQDKLLDVYKVEEN